MDSFFPFAALFLAIMCLFIDARKLPIRAVRLLDEAKATTNQQSEVMTELTKIVNDQKRRLEENNSEIRLLRRTLADRDKEIQTLRDDLDKWHRRGMLSLRSLNAGE